MTANRLVLGCVIWVGLLLQTPARSQVSMPETKPVPPELVSGDSLVVDDLNFRLDGPGKAWSWLAATDPTGSGLRIFLCKKGQTGVAFIVTVQPGRVWGRDPKFLRGLREGAEAEAAKSKAQILSLDLTASDLPFPESSRVDLVMKHPIGLEMETLTYVHSAGASYYLQAVWIKGGPQPPQFDAFVKSFRLLRPAPRPSADSTPWGFIAGFAVLAVAISPRAGRSVLTIAIALAMIHALLIFGRLAVAWSRTDGGRTSVEEARIASGDACVDGGLTMLGALICAYRRSRLKLEPAAPNGEPPAFDAGSPFGPPPLSP